VSYVSGLPDERWSEEKILELLKSSISGSASKEDRLLCLDEIRKRKTVKQINEIMELLLEIAKVHGRSEPESSIIIELISRLANSDEIAFKKFYDKIVSQNDNLLYCYAKIIPKLEDKHKKKCMLRLLSFLMHYDSFTQLTDEMYQTLVTTDNEDINKAIVEATLHYLRFADAFKVVYAVRITSKLASEFLSEIEPVIERTLQDWYHGYQVEILENITDYFGRIKDQKSIPFLLQIMKSDLSESARLTDSSALALASVIDSHPKEIDKIWEFLEKEKEHYPPILMAFAKMKTSINLEKLSSIVTVDIGKWRPREALRNIIINAGEQAKPFIFKMAKDKTQARREFAIKCLKEIGVSIEEYSTIFKKLPILQVYEFFYGERTEMFLENLWKEQSSLRHQIKKYMKFEYFVQNLFSVLGFVTLFIDPSGKQGVDLVAFAPNEPYILIIGCTTGVIKQDLQKMNITLNEMKEALEEISAKYRILPMLITSEKVDVTSADTEYARKNGIAILTQKEMTTLLEMLRTNGRSEEIIKQIEQSIPRDLPIIHPL